MHSGSEHVQPIEAGVVTRRGTAHVQLLDEGSLAQCGVTLLCEPQQPGSDRARQQQQRPPLQAHRERRAEQRHLAAAKLIATTARRVVHMDGSIVRAEDIPYSARTEHRPHSLRQDKKQEIDTSGP